MSIITLTTDFGTSDAYVAAMKGVILGINPRVTLVDISHTIAPQNIQQAAFILGTAYPFFPDGTVHLVVVDPGVGTARKAVIVRTANTCFVAPDNGVLSYVIEQSPAELVEIVAITKPEHWRSPVSPTFHGRDIFAPVAARLSLGVPPREFGPPLPAIEVLPISRPAQAADGSLSGHVIHIDNFGNLITNVREKDLSQLKETASITVGKRTISGISRTYAEGEELLALIGSSGYLEVSLKAGSAAALLNTKVGDEVIIRQ